MQQSDHQANRVFLQWNHCASFCPMLAGMTGVCAGKYTKAVVQAHHAFFSFAVMEG